ncbi:hypothetical protein B0H16DRAFT_1724209 [Mycena metata]|uniref:Uncharacterized protein n=1 Tax=Mycena metata TaxID=1033252 RepID=A0AAD7IYA0_9AGAR|nr:hypothetical protein B0H16DRAFT_1724209 [Mycena metata]
MEMLFEPAEFKEGEKNDTVSKATGVNAEVGGKDGTVDAKQQGKIRVAPELWFMFSKYIDRAVLDRKKLFALQYINRTWGGFYQPLIYESVNLRTYGDAECLFLHTLPGNKFLLAKITYLSFAFVIPVADTPESPLWVAVRASLPEMSSLDMLITSFTHADPDPLGRVLSHLLHAVALPSRLRTLHLRSSCEYVEREKRLSAKPWEANIWPLHISLIPPPILEFIFTTPRYIISPPTISELQKLGRSWTAQLRSRSVVTQQPQSTLECFTVNHGYMDEGAGDCTPTDMFKPVEGRDDGMAHRIVFMEGTLGMRLTWRVMETNHLLGEREDREQGEDAWGCYSGQRPEMFGGKHDEWKLGWLPSSPFIYKNFVTPHRDHQDFLQIPIIPLALTVD